jgi:inner membrane protein
MSPVTHLLASWLIAAKTTNNPRDCRLVTLAGILPDVDGLGIIADIFNDSFRHKETAYYWQFHHVYGHGALAAVLVSGLLACFARQKWRVALLAFLVFHLHLLCDLVGARGPTPDDLWAIYYYGPFTTRHGVWLWHGQWRLDGWQNRVITVPLFFWALWLASKREDSVVGVFNRRLDRVFVRVLHEWRQAWLNWLQSRKQKTP